MSLSEISQNLRFARNDIKELTRLCKKKLSGNMVDPKLDLEVIPSNKENQLCSFKFTVTVNDVKFTVKYDDTCEFWSDVKELNERPGEIINDDEVKVWPAGVIDWDTFTEALDRPELYPSIKLIFVDVDGTGITVNKEIIRFHYGTKDTDQLSLEFPRMEAVPTFKQLVAEVKKLENAKLSIQSDPKLPITPKLTAEAIASEDDENEIQTVRFTVCMGKFKMSVDYDNTREFWEKVKRYNDSGEKVKESIYEGRWSISHKGLLDWSGVANAVADVKKYPYIELIFFECNGQVGIKVNEDMVKFHRVTEIGDSILEVPRDEAIGAFNYLALEALKIESTAWGCGEEVNKGPEIYVN